MQCNLESRSTGEETEESSDLALKEKYDHYLETYLPQLGEFRPYAGQPHTWAYKKGFHFFKANLEAGRDKEEWSFGPYMDADLTKSLGGLLYKGRREGTERCSALDSCDLARPGSSKPSGCCFEMTQKDLTDFELADSTIVAAFAIEGAVYSTKDSLSMAQVHISLQEGEGCPILAVDRAPQGAEYATPLEVNGGIEFRESAPGEGAYVGHQSTGEMFCEKLGRCKALVKLLPHHGIKEQCSLSAVLLLCLPASPRLRLRMSVSVKACRSVGGMLNKLKRVKHEYLTADNRQVQLLLMV